MWFSYCTAVLQTATLAILLAGCSSPRSHPAVHADRPGSRQDVVEAHARYASAVVAEVDGAPEKALPDYLKAVENDPANEDLVLEVFERLLQSRQLAQAAGVLERFAASPKASAILLSRLGWAYGELGKTQPAIDASRKAIQRDPRALSGYQSLSLNYFQSKQGGLVPAVLEEALKVSGTDPDFLVGLGELFVSLGAQVPECRAVARGRAAQVFHRAFRLGTPDPQLRIRLADGLFALGKDEDAAPIYQVLLKDLPEGPLLRNHVRERLANLYLRGRDPKQAAPLLEEMLRENPTDAQTYYLLGGIAYGEKKFAEAEGFYSKIILLQPDFEPAYYDLAAARLGANQGREALAVLGQARTKFKTGFLLEYLSATAWVGQKDYTNGLAAFTAAEVIARARSTNRLDGFFYFQFGAACERAGQYAEAEKHLEHCLELASGFNEAKNYLGYMWADRGRNLQRARNLIEQALRGEPKNMAYLDSMGWVLFKLNEPRPALKYLLKAVQFAEAQEDGSVWDHLGEVYAALGDEKKACEAWRKSLALEPSDKVRKKIEARPPNLQR